jgi:hypothetical protein
MNVKSLDVVKNMDTVFQSKTLSKNFHWNAQNTVLIDDTLTKAKKQPDNILLIPTFDVIKSTETPDDFLLRLLKWTEMVPEDFQDIRPFIKENPLTSITL